MMITYYDYDDDYDDDYEKIQYCKILHYIIVFFPLSFCMVGPHEGHWPKAR